MIRWNTDILAIQEIGCPGHGMIDQTDYSVIYSGPELRNKIGVYG